MTPHHRRALIVGAEDRLSAFVGRTLASADLWIGVAARDTDKLTTLKGEIGAATHAGDASFLGQVDGPFAARDQVVGGSSELVVYYPTARGRGPGGHFDPTEVANAPAASYGEFRRCVLAEQLR